MSEAFGTHSPPAAASSPVRRAHLPDWLAEAFARRGIEPHDGFPPAHHLLTERDLPWDLGDEKDMTHTSHDHICMDLRVGLERRYRGCDDVLVACDLFVYFDGAKPSRASARRLAPDLLVAFGVRPRPRGSLAVWEEGRAPDFVLEILSESTWRRDVGEGVDEKVALYQAMGAREYFLFDPHGRAEPPLQGWAYRDAGPKPAQWPVNPRRKRHRLPLDTVREGMCGIHSEVLGLTLCHTEPWPPLSDPAADAAKVRWLDPATNALLETYPEREQRQAEDARASEDRARAAVRAAEDRARAAVHAAEDRTRAAEGKVRVAQGNARAARQHAQQLAAELAALKARLGDDPS